MSDDASGTGGRSAPAHALASGAAPTDDPRPAFGPSGSGGSRHPVLALGAVLVVFVLGHLPFLSARYVNIECWAGEAARIAYEGHWLDGIRASQSAISSPPLTFFVILPFYAVFGVNEGAARLPALLAGIAVILLVFEAGRRLYAPSVGALAAALVAFNPLFWTYTVNICCNDSYFILATLVTLLALLAALEHDAAWAHLLGGLCVGASLLVKYNAAAFVPVIAAIVTVFWLRSRPRRPLRLVRAGALYVPGTVLAALALLGLRSVLGTLINPEISPSRLSSAPSYSILMPPRLAGYVIWLGLLFGPLCLLALRDLLLWIGARRLVLGIGIALPVNAALVVGFNVAMERAPASLGEIGFGWIAHVLGVPVLFLFEMIGLLAGEISLAALLVWGHRRIWPSGAIALWTVGLLLVDGFWRGATRYLAFLLPGFALYFAAAALRPGTSRRARALLVVAVAGMLAAGLTLGIFNTAYFAAEGKAAADVAGFINAHHLEGVEYAISNSVLAHSIYLVEKGFFAPPGVRPTYITVTWGRGQTPEGAVYQTPVRLLGRTWKTYGIVPWTETLSDPLYPPLACCPTPDAAP